VDARAFYERGGPIIEGVAFEIPTIDTHYLISKPLLDQ
jgi:hypothetical protein